MAVSAPRSRHLFRVRFGEPVGKHFPSDLKNATEHSNPASNNSLKVRLLLNGRAEMSAARLSSSERAIYLLKASIMREYTRFRADNQT